MPFISYGSNIIARLVITRASCVFETDTVLKHFRLEIQAQDCIDLLCVSKSVISLSTDKDYLVLVYIG